MIKFNSLKWFIYLIAVLLISFSCGGKCKDADCGANGNCVAGACSCDDGYEGDSCESRVIDKFLGNFNSTNYCDSLNPYTTQITANGTDPHNLTITNLVPGVNVNAVATFVGISFDIVPTDVAGINYSGAGGINEAFDRIVLTIHEFNGTDTTDCNLAFHKQ